MIKAEHIGGDFKMRSGKLVGLALPALAVLVLVSVSALGAELLRPFPPNNQEQSTAAQDDDPLSGEWSVTLYDHDRTLLGTFKFKLEGTQVTGTVYSDHTGEGTIRDGKWLDGNLSFTADFANHESLLVRGIFKDGKLAGEAHHPEAPTYKWEAKKR
jgi:hypothetical protein